MNVSQCLKELLRPRELAHNAEDIVYTDGSKRGSKTGAGVFRAYALGRKEAAVQIRPSQPINRAELVAIWYALTRYPPTQQLACK